MGLQLHQTAGTTDPIESAYRVRTPRSRELFARADKVIPGGNSRHSTFWEPYPLFVDRAAGARLFDVDDNEYLDLTYNYTALVHGHSYPPIVEAVEIARGTGWAANNPQMVDLAEQLADRVASVEQVRFTNSGTEAGILALHIARVVTGRQKVLMARRGYHGSLMEFESGTFDQPGPLTLLADYNDLASFEKVLDDHPGEIAAVFVEPVMGSGGILAGTRGFLHGVRDAAQRAGALFVLDEVITFRLATGGRQQELQLAPDLTMFGKLTGGGFPVGAVGGCQDLMSVFDPSDMKAFHSGTYNANPVTMAAGAVAVRHLTAERIEHMHRLAQRLEAGFRRAAAAVGLPLEVRCVGSLLNLYGLDPALGGNVQRDGLPLMSRFHLACLNHGLMIARRGLAVTCTVMDEHIVDEAIERATDAMQDLAGTL